MTAFYHTMGLQRTALFLIALSLIIVSFFSGGDYTFHGWRTFPTLVAPTLVPILFFVLSLDILMSLIFRADAVDDAVKKRYRTIIWAHTLSIILLLGFWAPFFINLVTL